MTTNRSSSAKLRAGVEARGSPAHSKSSLADFDQTMRINARAAVQCAQAFVAGMRERGFGRIVSISSLAVTGLPGLSAYTASKAALAGLTRRKQLLRNRFNPRFRGSAGALFREPGGYINIQYLSLAVAAGNGQWLTVTNPKFSKRCPPLSSNQSPYWPRPMETGHRLTPPARWLLPYFSGSHGVPTRLNDTNWLRSPRVTGPKFPIG